MSISAIYILDVKGKVSIVYVVCVPYCIRYVVYLPTLYKPNLTLVDCISIKET